MLIGVLCMFVFCTPSFCDGVKDTKSSGPLVSHLNRSLTPIQSAHMFEGVERFRDYKTKTKQLNPFNSILSLNKHILNLGDILVYNEMLRG